MNQKKKAQEEMKQRTRAHAEAALKGKSGTYLFSECYTRRKQTAGEIQKVRNHSCRNLKLTMKQKQRRKAKQRKNSEPKEKNRKWKAKGETNK